MFRKTTTFLLTSLLLAATPAAAAPDIAVLIDAQAQTYDQPPVIVQDRCLVPLRGIFEKLGADIAWDEDTQTVTAFRGQDTIVLHIGSTTATKNGQALTLSVAPQILNYRTMVPVRFVAEALGADVYWDEDTQTVDIRTPNYVGKQYPTAPAMIIDTAKDYTAVLKTSKGTFKIHLFDKDAPLTVNNFVFLARDHYYDHVKFHRIIESFMIQTGDPTGTGAGGPGYEFRDELPSKTAYAPGIVAMANRGPNTNGSQFFIGTGDDVQYLNKSPFYTIFGEVTEGMEVVKAIAATPVQANTWGGEVSSPMEAVTIDSVTIEEK
jgi:cyclophilin family peptidyl-prolyl cis-trans isomerase